MAKSSAINYKEIGFRCGIEAHQQLDGKKLFCSCPTTNSRKGDDVRITRRLRAVIGETGEVDPAAAFEMAKAKSISYIGNRTESCLVEIDEEPPHPINKDAVKTALMAAKLLNAKPVDEIQVMRKTVIDGSNVSGFQRTALVAVNGFIETSKGKVGITSVCLEEEACQKVSEDKGSITYRLDRLGIPLIEIATSPDIKDNEHAKEVAEKIGMILRSTGRVKRGIGTIRQDVNVSIKGSSRVEIKGFQELKIMPAVIENETRRLMSLKEKNKPEVRKFNPDGTTEFMRPMPGAARMYPETDVVPIRPELADVESVELIEDKVSRLESMGIGKDLAALAVRKGKHSFIEEQSARFKSLKPAFIAETVCTSDSIIKKQFSIDVSPSEEDFEEIFSSLESERIAKESVLEILKQKKPVKSIIKSYELMPDSELEKELDKIISENKGAPFQAIIGKAMAKLRGKASGRKISEILAKKAGQAKA